jgi:hypothetical protein
MPKYIPAGEYKEFSGRIFKPTESDYMNKHTAVRKVIDKIHGQYKRKPLEKALGKMNVHDVVLLGMVVEKAIEKEVETRLDFEQKDAT